MDQSNYNLGYDLLPTVYEHLGETARGEAIRARYKASGAYYDVPDPWIDDLINDCYDTYRISSAAGTADHAGDTHAAIRILQRALTVAPDKEVFQFQMGSFYLRLRDNDNARRCFERCTVLAPDLSLIHICAERSGDLHSIGGFSCIRSTTPPVSYTHLDVYKRQF